MTREPTRTTPISYRPPQARRAEFERMVEASGLSANAFLNECVFGRSRHRPAEQRLLAKALAELSAVADALRRCEDAETDALLRTRDALMELRIAIMTALGRAS